MAAVIKSFIGLILSCGGAVAVKDPLGDGPISPGVCSVGLKGGGGRGNYDAGGGGVMAGQRRRRKRTSGEDFGFRFADPHRVHRFHRLNAVTVSQHLFNGVLIKASNITRRSDQR